MRKTDPLAHKALFQHRRCCMTRPFNDLGLPALVLPCGFGVSRNERPLPQGMQLVGRSFSEASLIQIGDAYQLVTDWHQRQPVTDAG